MDIITREDEKKAYRDCIEKMLPKVIDAVKSVLTYPQMSILRRCLLRVREDYEVSPDIEKGTYILLEGILDRDKQPK